MRFPFNNKFAPLTNAMGFIECDNDQALENFLDWATSVNYNNGNYKVTKFEGSFIQLILENNTISYPEKSILFQTDSNWIGFIENLLTETEIGRIKHIARRIEHEVRCVGVKAWQNSFMRTANGWAGGFFAVYDKKDNYLPIRHIMLSDQDKWDFTQYGNPLPFEEVEKYNERLTRNKFTPEMLHRYLLHFGIDFFNDSFYMPVGSKAYVIEVVREKYENETIMTLNEWRKLAKYE